MPSTLAEKRDLSTSLKILRIIPSLDPITGGPAIHVRLISEYLNAENVHTTVICLDEPNAGFLHDLNFKVIALGKPKSTWQYHSKLYECILQNCQNCDVIIQHAIWLYHGYAIRRVLNRMNNRIPVLIYPHGMLDPYYQKERTRILKSLRNIIFYNLFEKANLKAATAIIFTSLQELNAHEKSFGKINGPLKVNLGYAARSFNSDTHQQFNSNFLFFFGRIDYKKGLDILVDAWYEFIQLHHSTHKLIIAGHGWDSSFGLSLKNRISSNKVLMDSIQIKGALGQTEIQELILKSKATVLWSKHENFAQSVAESLSAGTPVLVSKGVNIHTDISNYKAGIVGDFDKNSLVEAIKELFSLPISDYHLLSDRASQLYEERYNPKLYAKNLKMFIDSKILI